MKKILELQKISVVIPMYNSENTIINALNSIKTQTAFDKIREIIVINDGSTDASLKAVNTYKEKNKKLPIIILNQSNKGVSSARNLGMKKAKGEWIALLDSDDVWLERKIEIQMDTLQEHPEIDFLGGDMDNKGLKILWKKINGLYKADVKDVCLKMFPPTPTAIFKRNIFVKIGGYDENQRYAEDGNYFLKICAQYNYYHLPIPVVFCGNGKRSFGESGLSGNLKKMYEGNIKNVSELQRDTLISRKFYLFLRIFYWLKYIRRIVITNMK